MKYAISLFLILCSSISARSQIINGGFESGTFSAWNGFGNGSSHVITLGDYPDINPVEGQYTAIISNGSGDILNDGAIDIYRMRTDQFEIVSFDSYLGFNWNFITSEFTGVDADLGRLDHFEVNLLPSAGSSVNLLKKNVSELTFSLLGSGGIILPDGSTFFETSGYQSFFSSLIPGKYQLEFVVADDGDGSFDSGLVIDNISVQVNAAPETNTINMMFIGIIVFLILKRNEIVFGICSLARGR